MYQKYKNKVKACLYGKWRASTELYIVTGDLIVEMSQETYNGIIFKTRGVLRDMKIDIYN